MSNLVVYIKGSRILKNSENRVLKRIFYRKREEVTGENCIMSRSIICIFHHMIKSTMIRLQVARMAVMRNAYIILVGKSEGKIPVENYSFPCYLNISIRLTGILNVPRTLNFA